MKRRTKQTFSLLGGAAVLTLMWPAPSVADTSLGGYSGVALAQAVRIQIYEPTIPIPSSPQIDAGIGYAKAATDTGPVSRGTASYLWPGDVVGDGFGSIVGNDNAQYWVQVNSRYPATQSAPAKNTAQLTDGNGMMTSSDGFTTHATVTGLGIAGPNTDLLGGLGTGLSKLGGKTGPTPATLPSAPVPVSQLLAGLATVQNVKSESKVVVADKSVTSTALTYLSEITLLKGLITIDDMKVTTTSVSDGKKATTTGSIEAGAIKIAGQDLGLSGSGLKLAGSSVKLPDVPDAVTGLLEKIGISVSFAPTARSADAASGSLAATGLVISIDTNPLKSALNLGGIVGPLQDIIQKIPKLGSQLAPLLGLGPKIVFRIADVTTSATAAPAYTGGGLPTGGTGGNSGGTNTGGGAIGGTGTVGGTGTGGGTGSLGGGTGGTTPTTGTGAVGPSTTPVQATGYELPGLGAIPRLLILGALALAAAIGWVLRAAGGFILGGGRNCAFGLSTGVPDLRKG